jgi:hypothetical protein
VPFLVGVDDGDISSKELLLPSPSNSGPEFSQRAALTRIASAARLVAPLCEPVRSTEMVGEPLKTLVSSSSSAGERLVTRRLTKPAPPPTMRARLLRGGAENEEETTLLLPGGIEVAEVKTDELEGDGRLSWWVLSAAQKDEDPEMAVLGVSGVGAGRIVQLSC